MQLLKITFIAAIAITMCSFAFRTTTNSTEYGREQLYKDFLSEFKPYELPTTIKFEMIGKALKYEDDVITDLDVQESEEATKTKKPRKILTTKYSSFIPAIEDGMISRMGPSTYEAEALLVSKDNQFNTVIYSSTRSYHMQSKSFFLATFDKEGKQIASQYLGYARTESPMEFISSKSMELTVKEFKKDDENNLVEANTRKLFVKPSGQILEHLTEAQKQERMPLEQKIAKTKLG